MKKTKFMTLIVTVLLFSILLTSCSANKAAKVFKTLYNEVEDDIEYEAYNISEHIADIDASKYTNVDIGDNIVLFIAENDGKTNYICYNIYSQSVVLNLNDTDISYSLSIDNINNNVITVRETSSYTNSYNSVRTKTEYVAYDFMGNELARASSKFTDAFKFGDLVIFNGSAYKVVDEAGKLEKTEHKPYQIPTRSMSTSIYNDEYYYIESLRTISIYNKDLVNVYTYSAPSYISSYSFFFLNDGKVLMRGTYTVEGDTKDFDYYIVSNNQTVKYKLYYELIDPEKCSTKKLDLDFYISSITSAYSYKSNEDEFEIRDDSFENIAVIHPIVDKKLDSSEAATDTVFMNNNGKVLKSIKVIENQDCTIPTKIANDRYVVYMLDGTYTLFDNNGKQLATLTNYMGCRGSSILCNDAIYDLDMNLIYDTRDVPIGVKAEIVRCNDDVIYVSERTGTKTVYFSFINGVKGEICRIDNSDINNEISFTEFGYTVKTSDSFVIYNSLGEKLLDLKSEPTLFRCSDNVYIYKVTEIVKSMPKYSYCCIYK